MFALPGLQGNAVTASARSSESEALAETKAKVYHAVGRNLVRLQQLESMLRFMCTVSEWGGPASQLERVQRARQRKMSKTGMGDLAELFARQVLPEPRTDAFDPPEDIQELHIRVTCSLNYDPERTKARQRSLRRIVRRRNRLVHDLLAEWNPQSLESSLQVLERLDSDHREAMAEHASLKSEHDSLRDAIRSCAALLATNEVRELFAAGLGGEIGG